MSDFNSQVIAEFRTNGGRVGGPFEGMPLLLLHHRGRRSGREHVVPLTYQQDAHNAHFLYVFGSNQGSTRHPAWYWNLTASGEATIEVGDETHHVAVVELNGKDRDQVFATQLRLAPMFAGYQANTDGRVIPVLRLDLGSGRE